MVCFTDYFFCDNDGNNSATILQPNVPWPPTIGIEECIQLFPAYPSAAAENISGKVVAQQSMESLSVYAATFDAADAVGGNGETPVVANGGGDEELKAEEMPTLFTCNSVGGTSIKRIDLDIADVCGGAWCLVRRSCSIRLVSVTTAAEASLHWLGHQVNVLRRVHEACLDDRLVSLGGLSELAAAALEEVISPVLTAVVGPTMSAWLIRDVREMQEGYRRRMKTLLKQEYIRTVKIAKESGSPEPKSPDYDALLAPPRDDMLDKLIDMYNELQDLTADVLEVTKKLADGNEALINQYFELEAMYTATL